VRALQEADFNFEEGYKPLEGSPQEADGHALQLAVSLHLFRRQTQVIFFHFFCSREVFPGCFLLLDIVAILIDMHRAIGWFNPWSNHKW
jgi:hypothetical protein